MKTRGIAGQMTRTVGLTVSLISIWNIYQLKTD